MDFQEILAYAAVALATVALVWSLVRRSGDDGYAPQDLRENGWERMPGVFKLTWGFSLAFEDSIGAVLAEWMPGRARRIQDCALAAALPLGPKRVMCSMAVLGLAFGVLGAVSAVAASAALPRSALWVSVLVFAFLFWIGWAWPQQNLKAYAERLQEELTRQLPFAIDLISSAMRSGLEFGAAMRYYVGVGVGGALQEEFTRVLSDVSLGMSFTGALQEMEKRVQVDPFSSFVGAVAYGAEVGAPLSATLKVQGAELRRSRFALAERKAARAPILMILPLTLCIMPSVFIVILTPLVMRLSGLF